MPLLPAIPPDTTPSHIGPIPCGTAAMSLTGHWGGISVGLRGFAPLSLSGNRPLGDCHAQVRPEFQFEERTEDAARFPRRAHRTLSSAEAPLLPGLDRGQAFQGIAETLRRAVLPARARLSGKSERAGLAHQRQSANAREGKSRGRSGSYGSTPDALARIRCLARRHRCSARFHSRIAGDCGAARYLRRSVRAGNHAASGRRLLQLRSAGAGNRVAENLGASQILRDHRFALAGLFCGPRGSRRSPSCRLARLAFRTEERGRSGRSLRCRAQLESALGRARCGLSARLRVEELIARRDSASRSTDSIGISHARAGLLPGTAFRPFRLFLRNGARLASASPLEDFHSAGAAYKNLLGKTQKQSVLHNAYDSI